MSSLDERFGREYRKYRNRMNYIAWHLRWVPQWFKEMFYGKIR